METDSFQKFKMPLTLNGSRILAVFLLFLQQEFYIVMKLLLQNIGEFLIVHYNNFLLVFHFVLNNY